MSATKHKIADSRQRLRALDPSGSFIVQAPAGSGKTELLVRRFLRLLAVVEKPERVLAITFTRKAAGEMRERITSALRAAESGAEADGEYEAERLALAETVLKRSREQGWDLLRNPGRLQVYTIDSFCSRLSFMTPLLSRFGATPKTTEDPAPLYREAARRVLSRAGNGSDLGEAVTVLLGRQELRLEEVTRQIVFMLERRDQWWRSILDSSRDPAETLDDVEEAFAAMLGEHLDRLSGLLGDSLIARIEKLAVMTHLNLVEADKQPLWPTLGRGAALKDKADGQACWADAARILMTKDGRGLRKAGGISSAVGAPKGSEAKDLYLELLDDVDGLPTWKRRAVLELLAITSELPASHQFGAAAREGLMALFRVLKASVETLWFVFGERGKVDFVDVGMKAVMALGDEEAPSELLLGMDNLIDHVLVDEFQDTSLIQCNLVSALTSGFTKGDGRTLFLVGDPMQSIYRFRKAEVGLFLQAADRDRHLFRSVELEPLSLTVNFRSSREIVDWVNATFSTLMAENDEAEMGLVKYHSSVTRPDAPQGSAVEMIRWLGEEGDGLASMIADKLLPDARSRNGCVAVLVRRRKDAIPLMAALDVLGVEYRGEEMGLLSASRAVRDLQSLTRFLVHRGDRLSGLALLHSPLVGLGSDDLCRLVEPSVVAWLDAKRPDDEAEDGGEGRPVKPALPQVTELMNDEPALARLDAAVRARVEACADVIARARENLGRAPLHAIVRSVWLRLGGALLLDGADAIDAERYFDLLEQTDAAEGLDIDEFERRLFDLRASGDPSADIDLELMTIHKAKGLEFDTVVVPGLGAPGRGGSRPAMIMETDGASGLMTICAPRHERGRASEDDAKFKFLDAREKIRDDAESLRLIYVAATRARSRLLLSTGDVLRQDGEPRAGSLLGMLWPALSESVDARTADALPLTTAEGGQQVRIKAEWETRVGGYAEADLEVMTVSSVRPSRRVDKPESYAMTTAPTSLAVGTVVHGLLERIAHDGLAAWSASGLGQSQEQDRIRRRLRAEGVPVEQLDDAVAEVTRAVVNTLEDDDGRWILDDARENAHSEWRLTSYEKAGGGEIVVSNASIDRSFLDESGRRWIVDYKTDRPQEGQDAETFLDERFTHHRPQLEDYARMVAASGTDPDGTEIRIALYFPLLPIPSGGDAGRLKDEVYQETGR